MRLALEACAARWRAGEIDDAAYAALYFLHWQAASHGKRFASRRSKADPRPDPAAWARDSASLSACDLSAYLADYFRRYQFFGVIGNVPAALAAWLRGDWPLTLCGHIPSPTEVLRMQVEGTRPVTVLAGWPRMLAPVLGKPNAFAFMVHDLEHAWKFYHDPAMHGLQRDFFRRLLAALEAGWFNAYLDDKVFAAKFDYLSSDMNTHSVHAGQFLRAILVEFHLRQAGLPMHEDLPRPACEAVSALMVSLLGEGWQLQERAIGCDS